MIHRSTSISIDPAVVWQLVNAFACDYDPESATVESFAVHVDLVLGASLVVDEYQCSYSASSNITRVVLVVNKYSFERFKLVKIEPWYILLAKLSASDWCNILQIVSDQLWSSFRIEIICVWVIVIIKHRVMICHILYWHSQAFL